jgi:hypothetical protein
VILAILRRRLSIMLPPPIIISLDAPTIAR